MAFTNTDDKEPTDGAGEPAEAGAGAAAGDEAAPRPRKRKKRKGAEPALPPVEGEPAAAPASPRDPELERLLAAFERGNYALVRAGAGRLAKEAERDEDRRAARELLRRIEPDPLAVVLLLAAIGLLAFLSLWYWSHVHAP